MNHAVFWDIKTQFVPHRKHITSPLQSLTGHCYVRFEVFMAVTSKNAVFWDVASCGSCTNRSFGATYSFLLQGDKNERPGNKVTSN
jgi:hypothetical protein